MPIKVYLFAAAAQAAEAREIEVDLAPGASLRDLAESLGDAKPQLRSLIAMSRWAVDHQFAALDTIISDQHEIALIPPVSGG